MITVDILPNGTLKEGLNSKFAAFLITTSQIPVYWIEDKEDFYKNIVKKGDSKKVADMILAKLRAAYPSYKKEYLNYIKNHLGKGEALQVGFTLYLYDKEEEGYFSVQKIVQEVPMDKGFFKMIEKPHKKTRWRIALEAVVHDMVFDLARVMLSEKYEAISLKEWKQEYRI